ncbi:MAG TPA: hypothetical protein VIE68_00260 [Gemmatimonadota bacterium]|jgi:hypothetical protein
MRAEARCLLAGAACAALALAPARLRAQVAVGDSVTAGEGIVPATALAPAFYDAGGRRDPFDPLTIEGSIDSEPRFETLRLTGVFLGAPGNSLVVLEDPSRRGHFLRVGDRIGGARLIQIMPDAAVFEVEEYGTARREVLRLERSEERP